MISNEEIEDLECTFKPKINKSSKSAVWKKDLEKPRGFEQQVERYKKA